MRRVLAALALACLGGCAGTGAYFQDAGAPPPPEPRTLADWPWREIWTGIVFQGHKVGFSRLALRPAADAAGRWELESDSAMRFRVLGLEKKVNLRTLDRVRADLTLESFRYQYELDGSPMRVEGESDGAELVVRVETGGVRSEQRLRLDRGAYPANALTLLPVLRGMRIGSEEKVPVFVGESQEVAPAEQRVLGYQRSSLFVGPAFKVSTSLLGLGTETWYDAQGRPLLEIALHGVMISALEDADSAQAYLVAASLNKDESLLEFSLLRSAPVAEPRRAAALNIALEGVPAALQVPSAGGQNCARAGARLECRIDRRNLPAAGDAQQAARYLLPTLAAPSNERRIAELAQSIAQNAGSPEAKIERLLAWIEANIAKAAVDAFSAVDVLRERRAECQGHAYLFAALARAVGLPTRIVNGIVYTPEYGGFLYHSWNEVWIEGAGWRPVDATFAQPLADATHLALVEGEAARDLVPLVGMLGRARIAALADVAHW
jgi:transglutaminase-like putative cysteine protease